MISLIASSPTVTASSELIPAGQTPFAIVAFVTVVILGFFAVYTDIKDRKSDKKRRSK